MLYKIYLNFLNQPCVLRYALCNGQDKSPVPVVNEWYRGAVPTSKRCGWHVHKADIAKHCDKYGDTEKDSSVLLCRCHCGELLLCTRILIVRRKLVGYCYVRLATEGKAISRQFCLLTPRQIIVKSCQMQNKASKIHFKTQAQYLAANPYWVALITKDPNSH